MKDKEIITIEGITYEYNEYYKRLNVLGACSGLGEKTNIQIRCPKCHNGFFSIKYGNYECIAVCKCGHEMTVYDG